MFCCRSLGVTKERLRSDVMRRSAVQDINARHMFRGWAACQDPLVTCAQCERNGDQNIGQLFHQKPAQCNCFTKIMAKLCH